MVTPMSAALKELHDRLMAEKPADVPHDEATCPLCAMETSATNSNGGGASTTTPEGGLMTTLTQEEHEAALAAAVQKAVDEATAALNAKIAEYEAAAADSEIGKAVADATAPLNEQISTLQSELDAAKIALAAAEEAKEAQEKFWAEAIAEAEATAAAEARKDERLTKAKEVAPEKAHAWLDENADRLAAMSDEDFEARLEEWSVLAPKADNGGGLNIPTTTSLTASRDGAAANNNQGSALTELRNLRGLASPRTL